jgi:hypothetical protein
LFGCSENQNTFIKLCDWLSVAASSTGILAPFGDVSCERGFQLDPNQRVLDSRNLFALRDRFVELKNSDQQADISKYVDILVSPSALEQQYASRATASHGEIFQEHRDCHSAFRSSWGDLVISTSDIRDSGSGSHGHCDQGSYVLFDKGKEIVTDPGSPSYFESVENRNLYRSSCSHNVTFIDGSETCELGVDPFSRTNGGNVVLTRAATDRLELDLPGFLINGRRLPVLRSIWVNNHGFRIRDSLSKPPNEAAVKSRIHLSPGIVLVQLDDGIQIVAEDLQWLFRLNSDGRLRIGLYEHSSHYQVRQEASYIEVQPAISEDAVLIDYDLVRVSAM